MYKQKKWIAGRNNLLPRMINKYRDIIQTRKFLHTYINILIFTNIG